jgi:hypothetical protein
VNTVNIGHHLFQFEKLESRRPLRTPRGSLVVFPRDQAERLGAQQSSRQLVPESVDLPGNYSRFQSGNGLWPRSTELVCLTAGVVFFALSYCDNKGAG